MDVLNGLIVITKDVYSDDGFVELWVRRLLDFVVRAFLVLKCVETLEDEFEHRTQVLGTRCRHKNVRIAEIEGGVNKNCYSLQNKITTKSYPKDIALAIARPNAADLPRPLAAVIATVLRFDFSEIASINRRTALA